MKHNLKTFPEKRQAQGLEYSVGDIEEWLKGFKEELQQLKDNCNLDINYYLAHDSIKLIDKILGTKP